MTTAQLQASQAIVYPDGTMQYHFRDFIIRVNEFIDGAATTAAWGGINGTLSNQTDLQSALDAASAAAEWGGITGTLSNQIDLQAALDAKLASADIDTLAELNTIVTDATLITDAPADGTQYARKDSAWTAVIASSSGLTARLFDGGDSGSSTVFRAIDGGASNNTLPYSWFNSFDGGLSG
jgi:hypothetical protein